MTKLQLKQLIKEVIKEEESTIPTQEIKKLVKESLKCPKCGKYALDIDPNNKFQRKCTNPNCRAINIPPTKIDSLRSNTYQRKFRGK